MYQSRTVKSRLDVAYCLRVWYSLGMGIEKSKSFKFWIRPKTKHNAKGLIVYLHPQRWLEYSMRNKVCQLK